MAYGSPYYNPYYAQGYYPQPNGAVPDTLGQYKTAYQQPMVQQTAPAQTGGDIIWVQGEAGAKSYLVAPGSTVMLMDSETQTFYFKSADASGMPHPLRIFDYVERSGAKQPPSDAGKYASVETVQAMAAEIAELKKKLDAMSTDLSKE